MSEKIDNFKSNFDIYSNLSESYEEEKENLKQENIMQSNYSYSLQNSKNNQYINQAKKNNSKSKFLNDKKYKQIIAEKVLKLLNNSLNNNPNKNIIIKTENIKRISKAHLNIYERSKKNLQRKAQLIKKKQQLKEKNQLAKLKTRPSIDEISKNILLQNGDYIPIQERARHLHHLHQSYCVLYQKKKNYLIKIKKKEKKAFNEYEWNNFIKSQEIWNQKKLMKQKAYEIIKENEELKISHQPKINTNSKRIISNLMQGKYIEDGIYNKLYNDFSNMQERKQLKLSNSLPSFKPFVNKGIKKSVFCNKNIRPNSALNLNLKLDIKKYKNINYKNKKKGNKGNKTSMSSYNNINISNNNNKSTSIQKQKTNFIVEDNIRNHSIGSYLDKKFFFNKNHIKKN